MSIPKCCVAVVTPAALSPCTTPLKVPCSMSCLAMASACSKAGSIRGGSFHLTSVPGGSGTFAPGPASANICAVSCAAGPVMNSCRYSVSNSNTIRPVNSSSNAVMLSTRLSSSPTAKSAGLAPRLMPSTGAS